jgi:hypothetical protein
MPFSREIDSDLLEGNSTCRVCGNGNETVMKHVMNNKDHNHYNNNNNNNNVNINNNNNNVNGLCNSHRHRDSPYDQILGAGSCTNASCKKNTHTQNNKHEPDTSRKSYPVSPDPESTDSNTGTPVSSNTGTTVSSNTGIPVSDTGYEIPGDPDYENAGMDGDKMEDGGEERKVVRVQRCVCMCVCMYACVYVCMCVCVYVR